MKHAATATAAAPAPGRSLVALSLLPLLAVLAVAGWSITGHALVPSAWAVSDGQSADIGATVDKIVSLDTSACAGAALTIGNLTPDVDPMQFTGSDCVVDFASNNSALGAQLTVAEDPAALPAGDAMKCTAGACSGDVLDDYSGPVAAPAGTSAFGVRLMAAGGAANSVWTVDPEVHAAADAPDVACQTASSATGTCTFRFGAAAKASEDTPGTYVAAVQFAAVAI